jgi:cytochrome b
MAEAAARSAPANTIKLWDLPVRLVHWSFVALLPALWWTGEEGELELHRTIGYVMLALVVFRLIWGVIGSETARFASFVKGPGAVLAYLRGEGGTLVGHNPVGAISVLLLLGLLLAQVGLGLFAQDVDGIESGPLAYLVEYDTADWAREMHHLGFNVLLSVIAIHVLAISYYRLIKRDDLITPMVTGNKSFEGTVESPAPASLWRALAAALLAGGLVYWVSLGAKLGG